MRPIAFKALFVLSLSGLLTGGCERALKVDPDFSLQTVLSGSITVDDGSEPSGVTISATNEDNPLLSDSTNTGRDGLYRIAGLPAGNYSVDATKTGYHSQTKVIELVQGGHVELDFSLEFIPTDIPSKLVYIAGGSNEGDPDQEGTVGNQLGMPFVIEVRDAADQPLSDIQVLFTVPQDQKLEGYPGGRINGDASLFTGIDGRVSAFYILGEIAGRNVVRVQVFGLGDEHLDFTAQGLPDLPSEIQVNDGAGQSALVGQTLPQPVVVTVRDQYGNPVPNHQVQFNPSGDGQADPAEVISDDSGIAQTTWTLGTGMGLGAEGQQLVVTAGTATTTVLADADHLAAVKMVITGGNNQSSLPNTPLADPLQLMVQDTHDNPVDGVVVEYRPESEYRISLTPPGPFTTGADGLVSSEATPLQTGLFEVEAVSVGLPSVSFTISGTSGLPGNILIDFGTGQWGTIGGTIGGDEGTPLRFQLLDIHEDPVGGVYLHFEPGTDRGTAGTLENNVNEVLTNGQGIATVTTLTLGTGAGIEAQWVTATAPGFANIAPTTIFINVFPDAADNLTLSEGDHQQGGFGEPLASPLVVQVTDQHGNPVPNEEVSWTSSTGGSVSPNPSSSDYDGLSYGYATMGSDGLDVLQYFTASITTSDSVTFTAHGVGHHIEQLIPASVFPGYPDPSDPNPENTLVPFTIIGGGFINGATVVWDYLGAEEDIVPDSVTSSEILFQVSADHFTADMAGVYMVSVRNPDGSHSAGAPFAVTRSIPDSGQDDSQCYVYTFNPPDWEWAETPCSDIQVGETYYGQDGHYHNSINQPSFTDNGDGTITDNLTQMVWTSCARGQTGSLCTGMASYMSQTAAITECQTLILGGYDDWELPTINDLVWIADYGRTMPAIDETYFPNPPDEGFWSATAYADEVGWAWRFTAQQGRTEEADGSLPDGVVRCVRNRLTTPAGRFVRSEPVQDNPIVTDSMTGLVWQGCTSERLGNDCQLGSDVDFLWEDALAYCEGLTWAGMSDWRMPQVKELFSIIDHDVYWPSIDTVTFPQTPLGWRYSATNGPADWTVMGINIGIGLLGANSRDWGNEVRCVRSDY